jgi:hypothetical protein
MSLCLQKNNRSIRGAFFLSLCTHRHLQFLKTEYTISKHGLTFCFKLKKNKIKMKKKKNLFKTKKFSGLGEHTCR